MFTVAEDLKTLLVAHDFTAHASITVEPAIRLIYEDHPAGYASDGLITIGQVNMGTPRESHTHRSNPFRIELQLDFDSEASTLLSAILEEIRKCFDTENKTSDFQYFWTLSYQWNGLVRLGTKKIYVDATEQWESKT